MEIHRLRHSNTIRQIGQGVLNMKFTYSYAIITIARRSTRSCVCQRTAPCNKPFWKDSSTSYGGSTTVFKPPMMANHIMRSTASRSQLFINPFYLAPTKMYLQCCVQIVPILQWMRMWNTEQKQREELPRAGAHSIEGEMMKGAGLVGPGWGRLREQGI